MTQKESKSNFPQNCQDIPDPFESIRTKMESFYLKEENSEIYFTKIKKTLSQDLNLNLSFYRDNFIHRRLYYRLNRLSIRSYKEYLDYLSLNPNEKSQFKEIFTIHVTEFFRDILPFRFLEKELIPHIANEKKDINKPIRILSAPCSTGEEPYSIAIISDFLIKLKIINNPVEIYGCDIDEGVIDYAEQGLYPIETLRNISSHSLLRNFTQYNEKMWELKPQIRKTVKFFTHDLLKPLNCGQKFDLICCRNFLIYISKQHQKIIVNNIVKCLNPEGFIMLGKTEGFPILSLHSFSPTNIREHIYKYNGGSEKDD